MAPSARILTLALLTLVCQTATATDQTGHDTTTTGQPGLRPPAGLVRSFASPQRWQMVGDYYFAPSLGLRATGGLQAGMARSNDIRLGNTRQRAVPYVGLGYSTGGVSANRWGGWGVSADIGVLAGRSSDLPLGRTLDNPAGVGELIRELRLTPLLQLGVSYAF
jgi:hypothetical protein